MTRIWLLAALLYGWGSPAWDGHRPAPLDRPLRDIYRSVNVGAAETRHLVDSLDELYALPRVIASLRRLNGSF